MSNSRPFLRAVSVLVLAALLLPSSVQAASLAHQFSSTAVSTNSGVFDQQRLGSGLSGEVAAVAFMFTENASSTALQPGWLYAALFGCTSSSYQFCGPSMAEFNYLGSTTDFAYMSRTGDRAVASLYKDRDSVNGLSTTTYPLDPSLYYYLTVSFYAGAGSGFAYGSPTSFSYLNGALYVAGSLDPTVRNLAFNLCNTTDCDIPLPDTEPPVLGILSTSTNLALPTITGTTNDSAAVEVTINSKTYATTLVGADWSVTLLAGDELSDGTYSITASSTDSSGNVGSASGDLLVDATPPTLTIDSGPLDGDVVLTATPTFVFTSTDTHLASTQCAWDGAATTTCSSPQSTTLADGSHSFTVVAKDTFGNSTTVSHTFTIAVPPPPPPPPPAPASSGGGGGVLEGPLSVGYQNISFAPAAVLPTPPAGTAAPTPAPTAGVAIATPERSVSVAVAEDNTSIPEQPAVSNTVAVASPQPSFEPLVLSASNAAAVAGTGISLPSWMLWLGGALLIFGAGLILFRRYL